jgi:hypothetical protein
MRRGEMASVYRFSDPTNDQEFSPDHNRNGGSGSKFWNQIWRRVTNSSGRRQAQRYRANAISVLHYDTFVQRIFPHTSITPYMFDPEPRDER